MVKKTSRRKAEPDIDPELDATLQYYCVGEEDLAKGRAFHSRAPILSTREWEGCESPVRMVRTLIRRAGGPGNRRKLIAAVCRSVDYSLVAFCVPYLVLLVHAVEQWATWPVGATDAVRIKKQLAIALDVKDRNMDPIMDLPVLVNRVEARMRDAEKGQAWADEIVWGILLYFFRAGNADAMLLEAVHAAICLWDASPAVGVRRHMCRIIRGAYPQCPPTVKEKQEEKSNEENPTAEG